MRALCPLVVAFVAVSLPVCSHVASVLAQQSTSVKDGPKELVDAWFARPQDPPSPAGKVTVEIHKCGGQEEMKECARKARAAARIGREKRRVGTEARVSGDGVDVASHRNWPCNTRL